MNSRVGKSILYTGFLYPKTYQKSETCIQQPRSLNVVYFRWGFSFITVPKRRVNCSNCLSKSQLTWNTDFFALRCAYHKPYGGVCRRAVNTSYSGTGGLRVQASSVAVFPSTRKLTLLRLSSSGCINGSMRHTAGGNPAMDRYPVQGEWQYSYKACFMLRKPG